MVQTAAVACFKQWLHLGMTHVLFHPDAVSKLLLSFSEVRLWCDLEIGVISFFVMYVYHLPYQ